MQLWTGTLSAGPFFIRLREHRHQPEVQRTEPATLPHRIGQSSRSPGAELLACGLSIAGVLSDTLKAGGQLFGMRNKVKEVVEISADHKIETPAAVHPGLPDVASLVILLSSERGIAQILLQKRQLLVAPLLNGGRSAGIAPAEALGVQEPHLGGFSFPSSLEGAHQGRYRSEGTMHTAFSDVIETLGEPFLN